MEMTYSYKYLGPQNMKTYQSSKPVELTSHEYER